MCATKSLRKAKSRLPLWGRWTRVSEAGEGNPLAPRTIPCPPAVAYTKGRYTLGAG